MLATPVFFIYLCEFLHVSWLDVYDVERLIRDFHMPQIDPEIVGREVRLPVAVHADGVDVVGVGVSEDPAGRGLHHQLHGLQDGNLKDEKCKSSKNHSFAHNSFYIALNNLKNVV